MPQAQQAELHRKLDAAEAEFAGLKPELLTSVVNYCADRKSIAPR
jgi:hypothetical protein